MWSDNDINLSLENEELDIIPAPSPRQIQPASVDLRLGSGFARPKAIELIDPTQGLLPELENIKVGPEGFIIAPKTFVLGHTLETVRLHAGLVGRVEGKSTWGRLGLMVHATAGFIDPGFNGQITLELYNLGNSPIRIVPGVEICQLSLQETRTPSRLPYGHESRDSKYQGQKGVTGSRWGSGTPT